ncbi:MAG TPA: NAD(P)-dependent oxidoreductase [Myxococcaceae bacterium]|nr:NAD(P)-dependent oxidoreductase [Myxococcaceae bacterium]
MELRPIPLAKRILVTGASGAVGSAVASRLVREGSTVRGIARKAWTDSPPGMERRTIDVVDQEGLGGAVEGMDAVVHCAAIGSDDLDASRRVNVDGVANLLAAMREKGCRRLVHISTVAAYDAQKGLDFDEESPLWTEPLDAYGFTKAEGERLVRADERRGLSAVILRPVVVLSMHRHSHWGPLALERARTSTEPIWPLANMPYVHVDSLVEAVLLALTRERAVGRAYNVLDGSAPTSEYLAAVSRALGQPVAQLAQAAPRLTCSGERIREELGYSPADRWREFLALLAVGTGQARA